MSFYRLSSGLPDAFRTQADVEPDIRAACAAHPEVASFEVLGESEAGRPLFGVVLGHGPRTVSLIAGAHADEPVGPETLRTILLEGIRRRDTLAPLLARYRFVIVPHINPDGEARNRTWVAQWPSLPAFLEHVVRERPGRDLEFGFPAMRPENRAVAAFLRRYVPFSLHVSLHGMAFSEGAMLLIERHWAGRTRGLRAGFVAVAREAGLPLHDHNREGDKGFFYIAPGFTTTPEGAAMRSYFEGRGDPETAVLFHDSSMEFVRGLGGDPLCLVTELPLFLLAPSEEATPGVPAAYLSFQERLPLVRDAVARGGDLAAALGPFRPRPLTLRTAAALQLKIIDLALEALPEALPM